MSRPPTSRDVAFEAGVSQATVSLVFTGRPGVSDATRERVLGVARTLGYRPNLAARSMRTRKTGRVAIVMPITPYNPSRLLSGAIAEAEADGYVVEVRSVNGPGVSASSAVADAVDSRQFEGVLTFASIASAEGSHDAGAPPVVSLAEFDAQMHVAGELTDAFPIHLLVNHLAELGYERFLHLSGDPEYPSARARRDTYERAVRDAGVESVGVVGDSWNGDAGVAAIRALPEEARPLAVIAGNDLLATGAIRGAVERGWSVPGDLSVTGWDDLPSSAFQVPSLTTVAVDFERLGARSMRRLLAEVRGEPCASDESPLQLVIWRESTGPASTVETEG